MPVVAAVPVSPVMVYTLLFPPVKHIETDPPRLALINAVVAAVEAKVFTPVDVP